jgi:eukaryotic translation initiation factor 2C
MTSTKNLQLVGSIDNLPQKYRAQELVMKPKTEIVEHDVMCEAVSNRLKAYFAKTKSKPQRIIYYRDGVSDGQFAEVNVGNK